MLSERGKIADHFKLRPVLHDGEGSRSSHRSKVSSLPRRGGITSYTPASEGKAYTFIV